MADGLKVLLVDDDTNLLQSVRRSLRKGGWSVQAVESGEAALALLGDIEVLVTDVRMPGMSGIELMREARRRYPGIEVIIMTAYATVAEAVSAVKEGVRGYLEKPFEADALIAHLREIDELKRLRRTAALSGRGALVGSSIPMRDVYAEIDVAAGSSAPLLITGPTGSGKDLAAQAVHTLSGRHRSAFVAVNLGALPRDLAEGELFGHEKGAFTGAHMRKRGRFALAHGGTLFLDEVTSLPLELQAKLLRALETKAIWPVGSEQAVDCDVRVVCATNADIEELVEEGTFREDLFYRINVLRVEMPALSARPEDIPLLARALLDRMCGDRQEAPELSGEALSYLIEKPWPGNVRELSNVLERALARSTARSPNGHRRIDLDCISGEPSRSADLSFRDARNHAADRWAEQAIRAALADEEGNITRAAKRLKINRTSLIRTMKNLGVTYQA